MAKNRIVNMSVTSADPNVRIALVENIITTHTARFDKIETALESIVTSLGVLRDENAHNPRAVPYREMITAVVSTLGVLVILSGYAQWWLSGAVEPLRRDISRVERIVDPGEIAVLKYRLDQAELRLKGGANVSFH